MSCRAACNHTADPVPPFFHVVDTDAVLNPATGEIEQVVLFHEGVRIAICYTPEQAARIASQLNTLAHT